MEKSMMYKDGNRVYNLNKFKSFKLSGRNRENEWIIYGYYDSKRDDWVRFVFSNELLYKKFIADYLK